MTTATTYAPLADDVDAIREAGRVGRDDYDGMADPLYMRVPDHVTEYAP